MDTTKAKKRQRRTSILKQNMPKEISKPIVITEPEPIIEEVVEQVIEQTKEPEPYKLNLGSSNMYECIGITTEETAKLFKDIKDIMRQPIRKAEKTQMLFDLINKDPRNIAVICWVTVRI